MSNTEYIRWAVEVCNQEYAGDMALLTANIQQENNLERYKNG